MEKSAKRGKIPQSDWPLIMGRYEAGETLASIARTYDCSPPAISYIISRSRARQPGSEPEAATGAEPQLVKVLNGEPVAAAATRPATSASPPAAEARAPVPPAAERRGEERAREANETARNGSDRPAPVIAASSAPPRAPMPRPQAIPSSPPPFSGEHRRTLHLSLDGNGSSNFGGGVNVNGNGNGANSHAGAGEPPARDFTSAGVSERGQAAPPQQPRQALQNGNGQYGNGNGQRDQARYGHSAAAPDRGYNDASGRSDVEAARRKDGGPFIDQELRTRVDRDIAAFLAAFDAALAGDTQESRSALREATDRLLRAGARTRIELERLEARVPLTPREGGSRMQPAWRQR